MKQKVMASALWLVLLTGGAWADTQGAHPAYVRALGDLRAADNLLQTPDAGRVVVDQHACDTEVRHTIQELSRAAHYDASQYSYTPPPGVGLRTGRLHEIRRLLTGALQDIQQDDDKTTPAASRSLTIDRLNHAITFINKAMLDSGDEP